MLRFVRSGQSIQLSLLCSFLLAVSVWPQITENETQYLVARALKSDQSRQLDSCAYTLQMRDAEGNTVRERFDPYFNSDQAWSLVTVNGNLPTSKQLDLYDPPTRERHPAVLSFDFIDTASLELLERTSSHLTFAFRTKEAAFDQVSSKISSTLKIEPVTGQLLEIRRESQESFKSRSFTDVEVFESVTKFRYDYEVDATVMSSMSLRLKARSRGTTLEQSLRLEIDEFDCSTVPLELPREDLDPEPEPEPDGGDRFLRDPGLLYEH